MTLLLGTPPAAVPIPPEPVRLEVMAEPRCSRAQAWEERMDHDAQFARFVREQTGALLRSAYLLTGSGVAAEDLVQETFARLYPKWDRVLGADVPLAYVRRSLVNGFLNQRRRPSSREIVLAELPEHTDGRDIGREIANRDAVWRMLAGLPDRQRAALVLRFFHDLPDEEIATTLQCRLGTVRSLVSRGLAALREQTADTAHHEGRQA